MKVKANLTTQTLEYIDSKPYIQGEDSRNKLIVYVDASVTLTNIQIAYQLQNGRNTIKLVNDGVINITNTEDPDYLEGYNGFVFNAPLSVTNVAGNFVATIIFTISTNVYKINVLNTVLKAVDFENFENALEGEKADLIAFMNSTASSITIIEQDIRKVLATTSTMANDVVQDLTALAAYPTDDLPDGFRVLVMNDSDYDDNPTLYQYSWDTNTWQYKGNFDWTQYLDAKFDGYKETTNEYIDGRLDAQDQTIAGLGQLHPSGVDTSTNILAFTTNKGIYIGSDTGYWYYWDAAQNKYVSGGVYLSTPLNYSNITPENSTWITSSEVVNLNNYNSYNTIVLGGINDNSTNIPLGIDKTKNYLLVVSKNIYSTLIDNYIVTQTLIQLTGEVRQIYTRCYYAITSEWQDWSTLSNYKNDLKSNILSWIAGDIIDFNNYKSNATYVLDSINNSSLNTPDNFDTTKKYLFEIDLAYYTTTGTYIVTQKVTSINNPSVVIYTRYYETINNAWSAWVKSSSKVVINITDQSTFLLQMNHAYSIGNCEVNISIGEYNMSSLIEAYYNNGEHGAWSRFIQLGNNNIYNFSSDTHLIANYTGDDSTLCFNMSMFNCDGTNFELNGLHASVTKLRYVIHDDPLYKHDDVGYKHVYNNCILEIDNSTNPNLNYMDTIGGGLGSNTTIIINGGSFKTTPNPNNTFPTRDLAYHGYGSDVYDHDFVDRIYVNNAYFEHTFAIGKLATTDYGTLYCQASNNSMSHEVYDGTGINHGGYATFVLFNNEIRD